jgi:1-acyl-sn-glycerol-3-phosphate acyltransferase
MSKRPLRWWIARGLLAITGWKPDGVRPESSRYVLIAAPHTTNWDFPYLLIFAAYFDLDIRWMGKQSLFRPPLGWIMTLLGGIPIVRHRRENMVAAMVRAFADRSELGLVVPAEGTRSRSDYWKSGFYHIATGAKVPIVLSYLDYTKKVGGFGPAFHPTGDVGKDMDQIRDFYAGKDGKYPERFGPIRLLEEEADPDQKALAASR